ncbi:hypothetical protein C1X65_02715 [Pseudomonas sp. FW305-70]|nr:hypothetical protein C1X65_02715 [Pseudomonas sp. FW305-70]
MTDSPIVGASLLAMEVNDDVGSLTPRGALRFFASKLAPTEKQRAAWHEFAERPWKMLTRRISSNHLVQPATRSGCLATQSFAAASGLAPS